MLQWEEKCACSHWNSALEYFKCSVLVALFGIYILVYLNEKIQNMQENFLRCEYIAISEFLILWNGWFDVTFWIGGWAFSGSRRLPQAVMKSWSHCVIILNSLYWLISEPDNHMQFSEFSLLIFSIEADSEMGHKKGEGVCIMLGHAKDNCLPERSSDFPIIPTGCSP